MKKKVLILIGLLIFSFGVVSAADADGDGVSDEDEDCTVDSDCQEGEYCLNDYQRIKGTGTCGSCIDSGDDPEILGTVTAYFWNGTSIKNDNCRETWGYYMTEYNCNENEWLGVESLYYYCNSCDDSTLAPCVKDSDVSVTYSGSDSDGGPSDYTTKGTVTATVTVTSLSDGAVISVRSVSEEDYCSSSKKKLYEREYISDGVLSSITDSYYTTNDYSCSTLGTGYVCQDGACILDSDADGWSNSEEKILGDPCDSGEDVECLENLCQDNVCVSCEADSDCISGEYCDTNIWDCEPEVLTCVDSSCGSYVCDPSSDACFSSCTVNGNCASGYACAKSATCSVDTNSNGVADTDETVKKSTGKKRAKLGAAEYGSGSSLPWILGGVGVLLIGGILYWHFKPSKGVKKSKKNK